MQLLLCDEILPTVSIKVTVSFSSNYFEITGIDTGEAPEHSFGRDEYIYRYRVEQKCINSFYEALSHSSDLEVIKETIYIKFSGINGCRNFRMFCDDHNIAYTFHTY